MHKFLSFILCTSLLMGSVEVSAIDLIEIKPDDGYILSLGRDIGADKEYLRGIAQSYGDRFVVTEESYTDVSDIDNFYSSLSTPLSLEELDSGQINLETDRIGTKEYQRFLKDFKAIGSLAGYTAEFEPISYFKIYRDIILVGGYVKYMKTYSGPDDAYWQYVSRLEDLTKEKVPYETRLKLMEKVKELSVFMDNDKGFKIFILKNSKLDSMYVKEDG